MHVKPKMSSNVLKRFNRKNSRLEKNNIYNSHGYNMVFYYGEEEEFWFLIMWKIC